MTDKKSFKKILEISEAFFGTASDPDQMPVSQESADKLYSIHPDTIVYKFDEKQEPIGWAVVVPTSVDVMNGFVDKKITERDLLNIATKEKKFESLYLCGAFILPEFRRKGYVTELFKEAIRKTSDGKTLPLYTWVYSFEGQKLVESLQRDLGCNITLRKE